jgi:small subunit ribosomal protein MRP21
MSSDIDGIFAGTGDPRYSRTSYAPRPANSSDEANAARMHHKFGEGFSPFRSGGQRKPTLDFAEMLQPDDGLPSDVSLPVTKAPEIPESEKIYPRLNASYGRVVELDETRGRDLVRGISILGSLMGRNKVRQDFMKQKFHERPGLKRKRLLSVRWRARFKKGFTQVTGRVTELTRKGW